MLMGPKEVRSTVLTAEEAAAAAFQRYTLLPLDDCLYELQARIVAAASWMVIRGRGEKPQL